jgi:hypothetical protein
MTPETLEKSFEELKSKDDSEKAFRITLAYQEMQDGAEWDFIEEILQEPYWNRKRCEKELIDKFLNGGHNVPLQ